MTPLLFFLIHIEDLLIQFVPVMPGNVPIFEEQFQNLDEFLSLAGVDVDDRVHILFHVSADISQASNAIEDTILIGGNFTLDQIDFVYEILGLNSPEVSNHSL